jgi:hypothetical protein
VLLDPPERRVSRAAKALLDAQEGDLDELLFGA